MSLLNTIVSSFMIRDCSILQRYRRSRNVRLFPFWLEKSGHGERGALDPSLRQWLEVRQLRINATRHFFSHYIGSVAI